jgi:hypothetical protein
VHRVDDGGVEVPSFGLVLPAVATAISSDHLQTSEDSQVTVSFFRHILEEVGDAEPAATETDDVGGIGMQLILFESVLVGASLHAWYG